MNRASAWALVVVLAAGPVACVSRSHYRELQSGAEAQRQQFDAERQGLMAQVEAMRQENTRWRDAMDLAEERRAKVERINETIHARLIDLEREVEKREAIIQTQDTVISRIQATREAIESQLREEIASRDIQLEELEGRLKVTFVDKILFSTGSEILNPQGRQALLKIGPSLRDAQAQHILVEGHTDDVPIGPALAARFPSNWELSAARAISVVRFLEEQAGVSPKKLVACGLSYHRPVAPNDNESGRRLNRRIEIILTPPK
jgi:chemotaxis protein MotB